MAGVQISRVVSRETGYKATKEPLYRGQTWRYLWITAPLPYRILPLPSCAVQILRGVLKTRAIRVGLWENNPSRLLEDSRELAESLTRSLLGFTSRISPNMRLYSR